MTDKLIKYRALNGLTQREVAQKLKITAVYYYRIEKGKIKPSKVLETRIKLMLEGKI